MHSQAQHSRPVSPPLQTAILLLTIVFLMCSAVNQIWATSSDLAHHYSLVARLSQLWVMPTVSDPSLGEMNIYPHSSHVLAAVLGRLVHSPMLGLQLTALLSMIAVWSALGGFIVSLPRRAGVCGAVILAVLMMWNRHGPDLDVFGSEDIVNFFYAQLVAQAFMVGALLWALSMERRSVAAPTRYLFLIAAIYVIAGMHLLAASQLLCVLIAQVALEFFQRRQNSKGEHARHLREAGLSLALMLSGVVVLIKHPAFMAMKKISQNDGQLFLNFFTTTPRIVVFSLLIAILSALLVLQSMRQVQRASSTPLLALKYIGLFGLAAAGLCLLQIMLLKMGQGSEYAIKKHIFTLNSVFFVELALLPACWLGRRPDTSPRGIFYNYLMLPMLTVIAFGSVTYQRAFLDGSKVVAIERQLELRRDLGPSPSAGKFVYARNLPDMPAGMDYLMTIGVFGTPRSSNSLNVLSGNQPFSEPEKVGTIITSTASAFGQMHACLQPMSNSLLAQVDGECAMRTLHQGIVLIGFHTADGQPPCVLAGFNRPEEGGTWTQGKQASLQCPIPEVDGQQARKVTIVANAFLIKDMSQRAAFSLNNGPAQEFTFKAGQPPPAIVLTLPTKTDGQLDLHVSLPDAVSPQQLGLSDDTRQLGVMISSLRFQ